MQLKHLDLRNNRITTVNSSGFTGLSSLQSLLLDSNLLSEVPSAAFKAASQQLRHLGLSGNSLIDSIDNDAFRDLAVLRSLDLSGCRVANISIHAFRGLSNLQVSE